MIELVRKSIAEIEAYQVPKEEISIRLDANENPYNIGSLFYKTLAERLKEIDLNRYPDTDSTSLRKAIGKYVGFSADNILCGNGSDEMIQNIIQTFVEAGDVVISHRPSFSMYKIFTAIAGGNFIEIDADEDFNINIEGMITAANKNQAKIIFLCNPNNPTGTVIPQNEILRLVKETKAMLVVDEAYYEFHGETMADWIKKEERIIVLRTLSKGMALAGARVGYLLAQKQVIDYIYKVKPPYNLNVYSQALGELFLENITILRGYIQEICEARERLFMQLKGFDELKVFPSKSNFILIKTTKSDAFQEKCVSRKVGIRSYGKEGILKDCLRITIGTKNENEIITNMIQEVMRQ
ncbi:histidinol-phosphate transaminase [Geosporobacter ferrireducens]|uniref:Histidinol-phosphate aminotransferase n=1 Tax=Geosporobacter ferrireducens TaxID=1424294 RepID=A0A1D8GNZ7_9FIRM|nr:histidinol-phosphate transaminase [Geosporobacter ferrireducens]AOT72671.1 histidinol-phosphate transaminase [Geosporobacter ferrireducens]MTI55079.1 histidinol-phosphate transaminase [Geosporobacter ferrireducens]